MACQPSVVLNAARSTSGRYPNLGPEILLNAGIPLIDDLGPDVMTIAEGHGLRVLDGAVYDGERLVAEGVEQTDASVALAMEEARAGLSVQLESFAANTMDYLRRERDLLLDGVGVPDIDTVIDGRQVLIVVRGYHYKEDLVTLRPYIREYRPVLIGVDGGADAILDAGWRPDLIVGDMDSVSDRALTCGAEVVVHAYRDGRAPGLARVEQLGVKHVSSRRRARARTSRCCWPTTRARSSSSRSALTPRSSSSSTRGAPGWRARSSRACGSVAS